jgi:thymidylate synthase
MLKRDPDSRRAIIHIRTPYDSEHARLDVPCTLALQFFIRDGSLHLHVSMRSSDVILGITNDVPAFTLLQELMALQLGVDLGEYVHCSNSMHIYSRDFEMAEAIIHTIGSLPVTTMPEMKTLPPLEWMSSIEMMMRSMDNTEKLKQLLSLAKTSEIDDYWYDWLILLASNAASKLGDKTLQRELINSACFEGYRQFQR